MPTDIHGRWYEDEQDAWKPAPHGIGKSKIVDEYNRKAKPQPKKWQYCEKRNSHQRVIQLGTQYEAWVHETDLNKNGIEEAFYDAFKYSYHPENDNWAKQNKVKPNDDDIPF